MSYIWAAKVGQNEDLWYLLVWKLFLITFKEDILTKNRGFAVGCVSREKRFVGLELADKGRKKIIPGNHLIGRAV